MKKSTNQLLKKRHKAFYGHINVERMFCKNCEEYTMIVDDLKLCCDTPAKEQTDNNIVEYVCEPSKARCPLPKKEKKKLLDMQNHRCIYCGIRFGSMYFRRGKRKHAKIHYDHFSPFIYGYDNRPENYVASCSECNLIKSSLIFDNFDDAQKHILRRRLEKGLSIYVDVILD